MPRGGARVGAGRKPINDKQLVVGPYAISVLDEYNYIIRSKTDAEKTFGYYPNLKSALTAVISLCLKGVDISEAKTILEAIQKLEANIIKVVKENGGN